jgi:preprotein translocase subunit SecF
MTPIDTPLWVAVLGNFGFPIAISIYLLIRFEKKLENLESVIGELSDAIKEYKR